MKMLVAQRMARGQHSYYCCPKGDRLGRGGSVELGPLCVVRVGFDAQWAGDAVDKNWKAGSKVGAASSALAPNATASTWLVDASSESGFAGALSEALNGDGLLVSGLNGDGLKGDELLGWLPGRGVCSVMDAASSLEAPASPLSAAPREGGDDLRSTITTVTLSLLPLSIAAFVSTLAAIRTAAFRLAPFSHARCMQRMARLVASCTAASTKIGKG